MAARKPTPVKLSDDLLTAIDEVAKETPEGNRSEVIRAALRFYFAHRAQKPQGAPSPAHSPEVPAPNPAPQRAPSREQKQPAGNPVGVKLWRPKTT